MALAIGNWNLEHAMRVQPLCPIRNCHLISRFLLQLPCSDHPRTIMVVINFDIVKNYKLQIYTANTAANCNTVLKTPEILIL